MRAFLVALEVGLVSQDAVYDSLPLHCTVIHWFRTTHTAKRIVRIAEKICWEKMAVELHSSTYDTFGPRRNIPVHVLVPTPCLISLHKDLLNALNEIGVEHIEPQYVGDGYRPHVTIKGEYAFPPGRRRKADYAYVVEAMNAEELRGKKVVAKIKLNI